MNQAEADEVKEEQQVELLAGISNDPQCRAWCIRYKRPRIQSLLQYFLYRSKAESENSGLVLYPLAQDV
jgi:hypothetical protein